MPDYKKMYFQLLAKAADAAELLEQALREGEEEYISESCEPVLLTFKGDRPDDSGTIKK